MPEINALPVGQHHRVDALQIPQIGVLIGGVFLKNGIPHTGRQLPDRRVVVPHAGEAERQVDGIVVGVLFLHILLGQILKPTQPVQRFFIVGILRQSRNSQHDRQGHHTDNRQQPACQRRFRNHAPPIL